MTPATARPLTRLRRLCLALPEAHEVEPWGEPTFRCGSDRLMTRVAMIHPDA